MSGGNNGKVLTVSRKLAKILTDSRKAITPLRPSYIGYIGQKSFLEYVQY